MDYKSAIDSLKSTRDFKGKKVSDEIITEILNYANENTGIFPEQKIETHYLQDGESVSEKLKGIAGYPGLMIQAPQYLLFTTPNVKNHQINVGYFVEDLLLMLRSKEVDSCWITIPEMGDLVKTVLNIETNEEVAALVGIGYDNNETKIVNTIETGGNYSKSDLKIVENNVSPRLSMNEIVYMDQWGEKVSVEKFMNLGLADVFRFAVMAPSSYNRQPWRFILKGNKLFLFIRQDKYDHSELDLLDAGIMMLYIEILMNEASIQGKWGIDQDENFIGVPDEYRYIGYFD